jgi:hypothetical protein
MKKVVLAIIISLFGTWTLGAIPVATPAVYAQKRDDKKKEPTPPVQRDKRGDQRPKEPPPKRDRRPESVSQFIP